MTYIIQQIALELAKKITEKAVNGGISDIGALASSALSDCKEAALKIIEAITEELNLQIRQEKAQRKSQGLVLKEKDRPRRILTELGVLSLKRDYYQKKDGGKYLSVLDALIGIQPYERICGEVCAKLVQQAVDVSYAKSAAIVTGGAVSRQTVRNQILRAADVEKEPAWNGKKHVPELHVYADEDHVHLQKPNKQKGKQNQIVPLVVVTEGTVKESRGRNKTVEKMYFANESFDTKALWKSVAGYIGKAYEIEDLGAIYLHGDGGGWIQNGLEEFAQKKPVIDGYHLEKKLKQFSRKFPKQNVRSRLNQALLKDDRDRANDILKSLWKKADTKREQKELSDFKAWLFHHWEEIVRRKTENLPGSCTEGEISHILSERFSRDPQGWSKKALGKLSKLRVYVKNGGIITKEVFDSEGAGAESYSEYVEEMPREYLNKAVDWSLFEAEPPIYDGASGTQHLIHELGKYRNVLFN